MSTRSTQSPGGNADSDLIRALVGQSARPEAPQMPVRRPRTDTRLVDPQIAPDLPELAGPDGFLPDDATAGPDDDESERSLKDPDPGPLVLPDPLPLDTEGGDAAPDMGEAPAPDALALDTPEATVPLPEPQSEPPSPEPALRLVAEPSGPSGLAQLAAMPRADGDDFAALPLLTGALAGFGGLAERLAALDEQALGYADHDNKHVASEARRLHRKLAEFEPSVVMIGQVKAGKTTLVNSMIGKPGLLPADVNPWTSVVTSIHLMSHVRPGSERATFRFFDEKAWSNLISRGGRMGELASRAGANEELERVRNQLAEMRERSRQRLGRRFEMLMGQTHDYEEYGEALIERYVCLGDDFWESDETSRQRGRFADITRSADLWVNRQEMPMNLCIRDTPGVNDTFMIREQITIGAIRGSKLCVVVLSASQALSTVDLALIRLISNLESRDIVIFVNRIDELPDPATAVPQIRESIEDTLTRHEGPKAVRIVFGSGHWANHAMGGELDGIGEESAAALMRYAQAHPGPETETAEALLWRLSGLPELFSVLGDRVAEGAGKTMAAQISTGLENLRRALDAAEQAARSPAIARLPAGQVSAEVARDIDRLEQVALTTLDAQFAEARLGFESRIERARRAFLGRATATLLDHLERYGEDVVWSYDPVGLRTLLRSAFKVHQRDVIRIGQEVFHQSAQDFGRILAKAHGIDSAEGLVTPPPLPEAPPPLALGQTIALDLKGSWWNRFWRRTRGYAVFAESFAKLIEEETTPIIDALRKDTAERFEAEIRSGLVEFVAGQRGVMTGTEAKAASGHPGHQGHPGLSEEG